MREKRSTECGAPAVWQEGASGIKSEGMPRAICTDAMHETAASKARMIGRATPQPSMSARQSSSSSINHGYCALGSQLSACARRSSWRQLVGVAIGLLAPTVAAQPASSEVKANRVDPVELRWVRLEGAEQCPPKASFEAALQKRLGKASFTGRGNRILTITLSNERGPFRVVLSLKARDSDEVESKQELFSYSSHCDEVFGATVLSVALLLNPDEMEDPAVDEPLPDSDFFDPPAGDGAGIAVPATESARPPADAASANEEPTFDIPIAPRPWARTHGAVAGAFAVGIEQLPTPALGFSARTEWPIERSWLLWLAADWLQAAPGPEIGVGVTVTQGSGWVGGAWLPYENHLFEIHLLGGLGVRQLTATLTGSDPRYHLALQLGVGLVLELSEDFALDTRATAVVPLRSELMGPSWTQPAIGGQLQIGAILGIPNPSAPN